MSRDIRELIDTIETKNDAYTQLERTIEELREEIQRLKFTNKEQRLLIQTLKKEKGTNTDIDFPQDLQILKELILAQRQDLANKDKKNVVFEEKIKELTSETLIKKNFEIESPNNEELIKAKKLIIQLTEENEFFKNNDENAKEILGKLSRENEDLRFQNKSHEEQLQSCLNQIQRLEKAANESVYLNEIKDATQRIKELNEKINELNQTNNQLKQELENAHITLNESSNIIKQGNLLKSSEESPSEDLILANQKIETLKLEIEDSQAQIEYFNQKLEKANITIEELSKHNTQSTVSPQQISIIDEENKKLRRDLDTANKTIDNLVDEIEGYVKERSEQGEGISKKNIKIDLLNTKIKSLKQQILEMQDKIIESPQTPESKLDMWYENQSTDLIKKLKEENKKLNEDILNLQNQIEVIKVIEDVQVFEESSNMASTEDFIKLNNRYKILEQINRETIEENEHLKDKIKVLEENQKNAPIVVGYDPNNAGVVDTKSIETIDYLKNENQSLLDRMLNLNLKLQEKNLKIDDLETEKDDLVINFENKIVEETTSLKEENQRLNDLIQEYQEIKVEVPKLIPQIEFNPELSLKSHPPRSYKNNLIINLLNNLNAPKREYFIEILLTHLKSSNFNVKRFAISLLSQFKSEQVFNAFLELIHDNNWIIRLYVLKALSNFEVEKIKEPIEILMEDKDLDVREAAIKLYNKLIKTHKTEPDQKKLVEEEFFREMEEFTPNRWNWCQASGKWVFIEENEDGKRRYQYQLEPPEEFIELTMEMKRLNEEMMKTKDVEENQRIFERLMRISEKMQEMRKG